MESSEEKELGSNYWYNIFIQQKALRDFEIKNKIDPKETDYNHYVLIAYIFNCLKYNENKVFSYKKYDGLNYVYLNDKFIKSQLPKIKPTMIKRGLTKLKDLGYIYSVLENKSMRYVTLNPNLVKKWIGESKGRHSLYLKKHDEEYYNNLIEILKKAYQDDEIERILLTFDCYRYYDASYNVDAIKRSLGAFITKWKMK